MDVPRVQTEKKRPRYVGIERSYNVKNGRPGDLSSLVFCPIRTSDELFTYIQ